MVTAPGEAVAGRLTAGELALRARRLRLVLTDCDGVLTDGSVYCGEAGEALLRFSRRDGMGVERLREAGIVTAIVTREESAIVRRRAAKLGVRLFEGVGDKAAGLEAIENETGVAREAMAFMGDDVNDLGLIQRLHEHGLTAAPADAMAEVAAAVHHRTRQPGGYGAFRELADWLIRLREPKGGRT
jgi:3-deoxy-D-manno-octulosonate 8-phosphate phosphatase (KDO 8-P phosphatase)